MPVTAIYDTGLATRLDRPTGTTVTAIGQAAVEPVTVGNETVNGTLAVTGATTPTGGLAVAAGSAASKVFHSGGIGAATATQGTDTTPATTETYIVEVEVEHNATLTGVSLLNGSAVAGNVQISLADSTGAPIAAAVTASTAQAGIAAYQQIPFAVAYAAKGPQKFFILVQFNNVAARFRSHTVGNFGASKKTGETFGTFTAVTPPTTFTTGLGPVADVY